MSVSFDGCEIIQETERAILVRCSEFDEDLWFPKSQIDDDSELYEGEGSTGTLVVSDWIAEEKGL